MDKLTSKEKLLIVAEKIFAEKGYQGASIREIAAAADINSSAISYYFNGKYGLYNAVVKNRIEVVFSAINTPELQNMQPKDIIALYVKSISKTHEAYPYYSKILQQEILLPTGVLKTAAREYIRPLIDILCRALKQGVDEGTFISELDYKKTVMILAGTINFYYLAKPIHKNFIEQNEVFGREFTEYLLKIFFRGISKSEVTDNEVK